MKQLRSKYVRIELENKHSAFSAALCKIVFWNMKYVIIMCEKMQRSLFDVNPVVMLHVLFHSSVDDYGLTYTLYYLIRHKELLKKHCKILQIISRIKLILFFMAIFPYFCGKRGMIFFKN